MVSARCLSSHKDPVSSCELYSSSLSKESLFGSIDTVNSNSTKFNVNGDLEKLKTEFIHED